MQLSKLYHTPKFKFQIMYVLALIGLLLSAYLWYLYSQPQQIGCTLNGGCEIVRQTVYSELLGVSLPIWGVAYYLLVAGYAVTRTLKRKVFKYEDVFMLVVVTGGFLFSVYLTYLEVFIIEAVCVYCLTSAIIATLLLLDGIWIAGKNFVHLRK